MLNGAEGSIFLHLDAEGIRQLAANAHAGNIGQAAGDGLRSAEFIDKEQVIAHMDAAAVGDFLGGIAAVAGDLNGVHLEKYGQGSHNGAADDKKHQQLI